MNEGLLKIGLGLKAIGEGIIQMCHDPEVFNAIAKEAKAAEERLAVKKKTGSGKPEPAISMTDAAFGNLAAKPETPKPVTPVAAPAATHAKAPAEYSPAELRKLCSGFITDLVKAGKKADVARITTEIGRPSAVADDILPALFTALAEVAGLPFG
jgi:hypothetical protein